MSEMDQDEVAALALGAGKVIAGATVTRQPKVGDHLLTHEQYEALTARLAEAERLLGDVMAAWDSPRYLNARERDDACIAPLAAARAFLARAGEQGAKCPTCDTYGPHTVMGADGIPDHRWPE